MLPQPVFLRLDLTSFTVVFRLYRGNARAVHEDNLPVACLLFEESRFQPVLLRGTGSVGNATLIDVGDPGGVAVDMHVGFGHIPLVMLARGMLCLDNGYNRVSVESGAAVKHVKVWSNDGIELCRIVCKSSSEGRPDGVYDLLLLSFRVYIFGEKRHDR